MSDNIDTATLRVLLETVNRRGHSPLPWELNPDEGGVADVDSVGEYGVINICVAEDFDAALIAAAVNALPTLLTLAEEHAALVASLHLHRAKYHGRSGWVGFEPARREAWVEIATDLDRILTATTTKADQ